MSVATRWSIVLAAGADDAAGREALAWLVRQYWAPLCAHARRRGWREAEDAVQDFLAQLIERGSIAQADPARGRFRAWLFTCLDHALANRAEAAAAQKRGATRTQGISDDLAVAAMPTDEAAFDREWAEAVLAHAEADLAREADHERWEALQPFLRQQGDAVAYRAVGARLGLGETAVKVAVHRLRARFAELVRARVAETLSSDDPSAVAAEIDHLIAAVQAGR
jgi:RNA polymerase sigma-70 factor (ECF subfamily)